MHTMSVFFLNFIRRFGKIVKSGGKKGLQTIVTKRHFKKYENLHNDFSYNFGLSDILLFMIYLCLDFLDLKNSF